MLRISWQTLRARRTTLTGAFVAIFLAVTLAYATGLLMAGALSAPGPGRFAAADAVVRADPTIALAADDAIDVVPAPRLDRAVVDRVAQVDGVRRAVGDVSFPVSAGRRTVQAHGWDAATLTPFTLRTGRAPAAARDVVADARLGLRPGDRVRIGAPGGDATYRVSGVAEGRGPAAVFLTAGTAAALSDTPGQVNAIGVLAQRGTPAPRLRANLEAALGTDVDVLGRDHAADADAGDPRAEQRASLIAIFGTMGGIAGSVALFV